MPLNHEVLGPGGRGSPLALPRARKRLVTSAQNPNTKMANNVKSSIVVWEQAIKRMHRRHPELRRILGPHDTRMQLWEGKGGNNVGKEVWTLLWCLEVI